MKAIYFPALWHAAGAVALSFTIAACIPQVDPIVSTPEPVASPAPSLSPVPTPTTTPTSTSTPTPVVQEPEYANYLDAPQTPGTWEYAEFPSGSQALYNSRDTATSFAINCIALERRITLMRPVAVDQERVMTLTAETSARTLQARPAPGGAPGLLVSLDPNDPLLDAIAITKGRFAVETRDMQTLYIPAWVEVSRVIEDCR